MIYPDVIFVYLTMHIKILKLLLSIVFFFNTSIAIAAELIVRIDNPPASGMVALVLFDSANAFGDLRDPA